MKKETKEPQNTPPKKKTNEQDIWKRKKNWLCKKKTNKENYFYFFQQWNKPKQNFL